eukprot:2846818-Rhodomonas_salina.3
MSCTRRPVLWAWARGSCTSRVTSDEATIVETGTAVSNPGRLAPGHATVRKLASWAQERRWWPPWDPKATPYE